MLAFNVGLPPDIVVRASAVAPLPDPALAIAILARGGAAGAERRRAQRDTFLADVHAAAAHIGVIVVHRFFLPHTATDNDTLAELRVRDDLQLVSGSHTYDLFNRTLAACRWSDGARAHALLKTDDDSWVNAAAVLEPLVEGRVPAKRLYWGREMGAGKPVQWPGGCKPESAGVHAECPRYMTGMGYVLSGDIVHVLATLGDEWFSHTEYFEDAGVGMALSGFRLHRIDDARFHDVRGNPLFMAPLSATSIVAHHLSAGEIRDANARFGRRPPTASGTGTAAPTRAAEG